MPNTTHLQQLDADISRVKTRLPSGADIEDILLDSSEPQTPVVIVIAKNGAGGARRVPWTPEEFRREFAHLLRE